MKFLTNSTSPLEAFRRHSSLSRGSETRKCPSPMLPEIPDIMHDCPLNLSRSFDAAASQANTQDDRVTIKILNSSTKLNSYGTRQQALNNNSSSNNNNNNRNRRKYSLDRIHRTSSLTHQARDFESFARRSARAAGSDDLHPNGGPEEPPVAVSDIIGSFGLFQLLVLIFSGMREGLVGYDALIMSVILQPESRFLCTDNLPARTYVEVEANKSVDFEEVLRLENDLYNSNLSTSLNNWNESAQCFRSLDGGKTVLRDGRDEPVACQRWIFSNESAQLGPSLVAEWSLVCQHHWMVAFVESAFFFGLVTGNLVWGYYADKVGRRPAYLAAHTISLIFGSLAVVMPSIYLFSVCRFLSAFGSIGYNIIYSIQVELIGAKHRSFSTTLNHLGWGLGVICIPLVDHLFDDYRPIIAIAPLLSLMMYPWAFWLPESPRWLITNDRYKEARRELIRAAKFNGKQITAQLDKKMMALEQRAKSDKITQKAAHELGSGAQKRSYRLIFSTPTLLRDTLIISYVSFAGHLYYYVQTINFAYMENLSIEANFITSGAGEWVSVLVGAILLKCLTRKTCMSLCLAIMACSFAFQSLIDSNLLPELNTTLIITTNNGLGTLASLLLVFVALIVNQEVYPTVVRQTGTSITNTVGESGSTLAPMLIQFSRIIGPWKANSIYAVFCSLGILAVQFVTRTDDIELPDT